MTAGARTKHRIVGTSMPQVNAREKVTGSATFVADMTLPQMLHGKVLRSPYPHARIVHIDVERARRLPGVRAIVTGADVRKKHGLSTKDETILATDRVRFAGEEVLAVAAVDENVALDALELITVEYEELPAVFDPDAALRAGAPEVHEGTGNVAREITVTRGDVEAGLKAAHVVHEATYQTNYQYHAFTEPMGSLVSVDAQGRLTVWCPTQSIYFTRHLLSEALDVPISTIRVIQTYIGGGFGGKLSDDRNTYITALLAMKAGRPVRIINSRLDDFLGNRPRLPQRVTLRMGVSREGFITAKDAEIVADNGAYSGFAPEVMLVTSMRIDSLYRQTNVRAHARLVYTNKIPTGAFRGFGAPQMAFPLDSHLDALAARLGMDPVEIRRRNAIRTGDVSCHGYVMSSSGFTDCLNAVEARVADARRAPRPREGRLRRGIGFGAAIHVSANRQLAAWDGSTVAIKFNEDGRVNLICGESDMGQGLNTVLVQMAAETLGIRPEHITVSVADTESTPYCFGGWASRQTITTGHAVILAAQGARQQLLGIAADKLEVAVEDLTINDGVIHVVGAADKNMTVAQASLAHIYRRNGEGIFSRATHDHDTVQPDKDTYYGNLSPAYSFAAQAAEVEVDTETGTVRLVRIVAADDVGTPINPMAVEGQVEGSIGQSIGYALSEELILEDGRLVNGNLADYSVPTAEMVPPIETILVDVSDPNGPFGAKGGSECPFSPTAGAIANAVHDAVGVRITSLPITAEKVLRALRERERTERRALPDA
jgi:CO/xanthine dehydrogenase Mo-binding subunit